MCITIQLALKRGRATVIRGDAYLDLSVKLPLRKICQYLELFGSVISPNTGKYGPE